MKLNLTMLVHNRPRLTAQALRTLAKCNLDSCTLTILLHRCDHETVSLVEDAAALLSGFCHCVMLLEWGEIGTGDLRNMVIASSVEQHGVPDFIYLSDNDVAFIDPDWPQKLVTALVETEPHGYKVMGAYNHPYNGPIDGEPWIRVNGFSVYPVYALALQSTLMSWETWQRYGPYCSTPPGKVCQSEDADFSTRLRNDGNKNGVVHPPMLVNCGITNSFGVPIPGAVHVRDQCPEGILCE